MGLILESIMSSLTTTWWLWWPLRTTRVTLIASSSAGLDQDIDEHKHVSQVYTIRLSVCGSCSLEPTKHY